MRGSLILRLVDLTLLLLLSLMAASSIRLGPVEPPVTVSLENSGRVQEPLRLLLHSDGTFHQPGVGQVTLEAFLERHRGPVEFVADGHAPARMLAEGNRAANAAGRTASFVVKRMNQ